MIAFVSGILAGVEDDSAIVDVGGLGYRVFITNGTAAHMGKPGDKVKLITYYQVKEDSAALFGFLKQEERDMFVRLLGVTGIGAKIAMAILNQLSVSELSLAVVTGDAASIARAPGVGKKTAQRICLELKDKVDNTAVAAGVTDPAVFREDALGVTADAVEGLMSLGYSNAEAAKAVSMAVKSAPEAGTDQLIMLALRAMDQNKRR